jgi:hypothetical protein
MVGPPGLRQGWRREPGFLANFINYFSCQVGSHWGGNIRWNYCRCTR